MLKATRRDRPSVANQETNKRSNNPLTPKNFNSGYFKKYFLYIIILILLLFFSFIFFAPMFINLKVWKPEIISMLEENTGKTAKIRGDIELKIYPSPQIKVHNISLVDEKSGVISNFLRSDSITAKLSFFPLLKGNIEIESILFDNLTLNLLNTSDRKPNWVLEKSLDSEENINDVVNDKYLKFNQIKYPKIKVNEFNVANGTIIYNNTSKLNFYNININTSKKINIIEGQININGSNYKLNSSFNKLENSEDYWSTKLTINNNNIDIKTDLNIRYTDYFPEIEGKLDVSYDNLKKIFNIDTIKYLSLLDKKSKFNGDISLSFTNNNLFYSIFNINANMDALSFTGALSGNSGLEPKLEMALSSNSLDLDKIIDHINNINTNNNNKRKEDSISYWDKHNAKFIFTIGTSKLLDYPIRNLSIEINKEKDNYILNSGYATFPGNTEIKLGGLFKNNFSIFEGTCSLTSDNIRDFYRWLSIDLNNISNTRLQKANIDSEVVFRKGGATFAGIKGKIDSSNFNGEVRLRLGEINSLTTNLEIDNLNLDSYLIKEEINESDDLNKYNLLNFDVINFDLQLKNLLFLKSQYKGITFKNSYKNKIFTIDKLNISDLAGGELSAYGNINYENKEAIYDIEINIDHNNFSQFYDYYQLPNIFKNIIINQGAINISSKGSSNKLKSNIAFKNENSKIDYIGIIDINNFLINSYKGKLNVFVNNIDNVIDLGLEGETIFSSDFEMKDNTFSIENISINNSNFNYAGNIILNKAKDDKLDFDVEFTTSIIDVSAIKSLYDYFYKDLSYKYKGILKVNSDLFTINNYEISDFNILLNVDDEAINLKRADGKLFGGSVNTNVKFSIINPDEYEGKIIFKNIKSSEFFTNYFAYGNFTSSISSEFIINGRADNFEEIFNSMIGEGDINFKKNIIKGLDINSIINVANIDGSEDLIDYVYKSFSTDKDKKLDNFTINSKYENSNLILQTFEIKNDNFFTLTEGNLNFKNNDYDISTKFFKNNDLENFLSLNLSRSNKKTINLAKRRTTIDNTDITVNKIKDNNESIESNNNFENVLSNLADEDESNTLINELLNENNVSINNEIQDSSELFDVLEENNIKRPLPVFIQNIQTSSLLDYFKPDALVNNIPLPRLPTEEDILDDLLDSVLSPND